MTFQLQIDKSLFQFHIIFVGMNPITDGANNRPLKSARNLHVPHPLPAPPRRLPQYSTSALLALGSSQSRWP
jgi:hypothetical protein